MVKTNKNVHWIDYIYYNKENKLLFLDGKSDNISYDKNNLEILDQFER